MQDIRFHLEHKAFKQMNFGVIPIGGYSLVLQRVCVKVSDFYIKLFNYGDEINEQCAMLSK